MSREVREFKDLEAQDFVRFPFGRGVLWTVIWAEVSPRGDAWIYADSGIIKQSFRRPVEWPMTCVVLGTSPQKSLAIEQATTYTHTSLPEGERTMNAAQIAVEEFHRKMGLTIGHTPELRDNEVRAKLILKKAAELANSLTGDNVYVDCFGEAHSQGSENEPNFVKALEDIGDLLYILYGTGVTCGVDLEPIFEEVHVSNMTKYPDVDEEGRVMKGLSYIAPFMGRHIKEQLFPDAEIVSADDATPLPNEFLDLGAGS